MRGTRVKKLRKQLVRIWPEVQRSYGRNMGFRTIFRRFKRSWNEYKSVTY